MNTVLIVKVVWLVFRPVSHTMFHRSTQISLQYLYQRAPAKNAPRHVDFEHKHSLLDCGYWED